MAAPLVGVASGQLTVDESVRLLVDTVPRGADGMELTIVVEAAAERDVVDAIVRRVT